MIIEALIVSYILLIFSKKKVKKTIKFNKRGFYLCLVGVALSILNIVFTSFNFGAVTNFFIEKYYYSHVLSLLFICLGIFINYELPGFKLIGLGLFANLLVIFLNGKMPVDSASLISINKPQKYFIISQGLSLSHGIFENPKLRILSDIIALKPPYPNPRVISIGDIIISIGIIIYVYNLKE